MTDEEVSNEERIWKSSEFENKINELNGAYGSSSGKIGSREDIQKLYAGYERRQYLHVQIHFKRAIKRSLGSIEFAIDKDRLKGIVKGYCGSDTPKCKLIICENRKIHPSNVDRISICLTDYRPTENVLNGIQRRSLKYDYLKENAVEIFERFKKDDDCNEISEWWKINRKRIIIPLVVGAIAGTVAYLLVPWHQLKFETIVGAIVGIIGTTTAIIIAVYKEVKDKGE